MASDLTGHIWRIASDDLMTILRLHRYISIDNGEFGTDTRLISSRNFVWFISMFIALCYLQSHDASEVFLREHGVLGACVYGSVEINAYLFSGLSCKVLFPVLSSTYNLLQAFTLR